MDADPSLAADSPHPVASPTPIRGGRAIAPDFARGLMLALIAMANIPYFILGQGHRIGAHAADGTWADRLAQTIAIIGIDARVYPMFAFLFGYGITQMYTRQLAAGADGRAVRRVLQRRHAWLIVFGFVHAALLWFGDILGAYGIVGLLAVWLFLGRADRIIGVWAGALLMIPTLVALNSLAAGLFGLGPAPSLDDAGSGLMAINATTGYFDAMLARIVGWFEYAIPSALLGCIIPAAGLLGMVAARHRILDLPADHGALLKKTAIVGLAVGWSTGALLALQNLNALGIGRDDDWMLQPLHTLGGLFGGLGYVALFGLIAARIERGRRCGAVASAVQALGKRSLSGYLLQSLIYSPLFAAWGFGLGHYLSSWSATLIAVAVWVASVVIAAGLERAGRRGPSEWLLRRLAYGRV